MNKLLTYFLLLGSFAILGQNNRLQIVGNLKVDTLLTDTLMIANGNNNQLLLTDGSKVNVGTGLLLLNNTLSAAVSSGSKNLFLQTKGTEVAIKNGAISDTLVLPFASATAPGLVGTGPQVFSGIKSFNKNLLLQPNAKIQFKSGNALSDTITWQIRKDENDQFVMENLQTGKAKMTFNSSGNLVITDNQAAAATKTAKIYSQGFVIADRGFRVTGGTNQDLLMANGTVKRNSFFETIIPRALYTKSADTLVGIGINTTSPRAFFEINGTGYDMRKIFRVSSANDVSLNVNNNSTNYSYTGVTFQRNNTERAFFGLIGGTTLAHFVMSAAKVGIGTSNPSATLHVNGTIRVDSSIKISSSGNQLVGSDGKMYSLARGLSLSNGVLSSFIKNLSLKSQVGFSSAINLTAKDELFLINSTFAPDINLPNNPPTGTRIILKNIRATGSTASRILATNTLRNNEGQTVSNYSLEANKTMAVFYTGTYWLREYDITN